MCTSQSYIGTGSATARWHFGIDKGREISISLNQWNHVKCKEKNWLTFVCLFVSHVHDVPQVSLVKESDLSFIGSGFGTLLLLHSISILRFSGERDNPSL